VLRYVLADRFLVRHLRQLCFNLQLVAVGQSFQCYAEMGLPLAANDLLGRVGVRP
jgi:hypothetical protein